LLSLSHENPKNVNEVLDSRTSNILLLIVQSFKKINLKVSFLAIASKNNCSDTSLNSNPHKTNTWSLELSMQLCKDFPNSSVTGRLIKIFLLSSSTTSK